MPWEEELKQLDTDFAEGRIAQDEYRRLRDDLLARASAPVSTPRTALPALVPPLVETPLEPPAWRAANPGHAPVDTPTPAPAAAVWTPPAGDEPPARASETSGRFRAPEPLPEMLGTEPPWLTGDGGLGFEPSRPPDQTPTQTPPPAQPQPGPDQVVRVPGAELTVPTGTARVASLRAGERLDGAEVFRSARPERAHRALPLLLVVVVLVVLAGGVWLVSGRDDGGAATAGRPVPVTTAPPRIPSLSELAARLPVLPGAAKPGTGVVAPEAGAQLGFYSAGLAAELRAQGVRQVLLRDTHNGAFNYLLVVVPGGSATGAKQVTTLMRGYEASVGMGATTVAGLPGSVYCSTVTVAGQTVVTGLFHSGGYTLWLGVGMVPAGNPAAVSGEFRHTADGLLAVAKPD